MRAARFITLAIILLSLTAVPSSAVYIRINTGTTFGSSGDIVFGGTSNSVINFATPAYPTFPSASSTDVGLGAFFDFTLTGSNTLQLTENTIEAQETGARSFWVTLSLQYRFSPSASWTTLPAQNITISSPSGAEVGQIPVRTGAVTDVGANESDPWDVRFLFDGLYAQWTLSDGNVLTAQIFGPAGFTGASINPVEWNYTGDVEALYARFTYDTPEPATFVLLGSALLGLGLLRLRRK